MRFCPGVDRAELYETSKTRRQIRVHDLRATFVTLALATGRTETWVADRTGHKSSMMINRYRRAARTVEELGLGWLVPLDEAIPEIRCRVSRRTRQQPQDTRCEDSGQAIGIKEAPA